MIKTLLKNKRLKLILDKRRPSFILKISFFLLISLLSMNQVFAQELEIKGTVTEKDNGEALPGVSIIIKGTTTGTITDFDGKYVLKANAGDIIIFRYVGYLDEEVTITNQSEINMALVTDLVGLEEVVVIGYGVQKKKLNTGATVNVKGEDLEKQNTTTAMGALKGITPGVNITSTNGVPGASSRVIIRGVGTIGDASPLYVVDGVAVGNIDYLAPSDIESIDVLKDAASTAIYGSRGANGVILVTTKGGKKNGKTSITYDTYYGWQQLAKDPEMANAQQYMSMVEEAYYYDNMNKPEDRRIMEWDETKVPNLEAYKNGTNPGTDWLSMMYEKNAPVKSHALTVTGGNETSTYSMGLNYLSQTGIIGKGANNTYERINARLNSKHDIIVLNDRSVVRLGENFSFSNTSNPTIATDNIYYNDLRNAITTNPLLPHMGDRKEFDGDYDDDNDENPAYPYHYALDWHESDINPVAVMKQRGKYNENDNNTIIGNVYLEIEPIQNLVLKSSYGVNAAFGSSRQWADAFDLGPFDFQGLDRTTQRMYQYYEYTMQNTLTYNFKIATDHNFTTLAGFEQIKSTKDLFMETANDSLLTNKWDYAYISNTLPMNAAYINIQGQDGKGESRRSYFGRISYDYKETLLASFIYRMDGSSKMAPGHKFDDFFSVSLGYILSNHDFVKAVPGLNYLKLRGGWGQNGNDRINNFMYAANLTHFGGGYPFGSDKSVITPGYYSGFTPNPNIAWETSQQTSIGFDAHFLDNRLQANFDWYNKETKDWLLPVSQPLISGTDIAIENVGAVSNKGIELALKWTDTRGDLSYSIGGNFAYNKNEVTELFDDDSKLYGDENVLFHGHAAMQIVEEGKPIGYFYGYETKGIIQNEADVLAYSKPDTLDASGNPIPYFGTQAPGDVMFVDQNGDGLINEEDRVMLGDPNPDLIYGFNVSVEYKGIYASINANGMAGHQIAKNYSSGGKGNFTQSEMDNRWHGEGTSNEQPRLTLANHRNFNNMSDIFIHDANFLRISNITIGYDLNLLFKNSPLKQARIYLTGKNLLTFTKYEGLDPEVGYDGGVPWGRGVDLGLYPASKTYMIGLSAKF